MAEDVRSTLRGVRLELIRAGNLLRSPSPEQLDRCLAGLERATDHLGGCRAGLRGDAGRAEALAEARGVRTALARVRHLMESAANHHRLWNRLLGSLVAGYTAQGEASAVALPSRVSLQG